MVLTAFTVMPRGAQAAGTTALSGASAGSTAYLPGLAVTSSPGGSIVVADLATSTRSNGTINPYKGLNFTTGDAPYLVNDSSSAFTVSRGGFEFTQGKVPGATYAYLADRVKETIDVNSSFAAVVTAPTLFVPFSTTYVIRVSGSTVSLYDQAGDVVWATALYSTWDSAAAPHHWADAVASTSLVPGGFDLILNTSVTSAAVYPLFIDPTWVLAASSSNVWSGTLSGVTSDWGDGGLKLGYVADNFNDDTNEIWTVTSGKSFTLSGGVAQLKATTIQASASWSDVGDTSTVNFAKCGSGSLVFRSVDANDYYDVQVSQSAQTLALYKVIAGATTALSPAVPVAVSLGANYNVTVIAEGNAFTVLWNGAAVWSGSDPAPPASPLSGGIGLSAAGSGCTVSFDNVRAWNPYLGIGNYTSPARTAVTSDVPTEIRYLGGADAYDSVDFWINSSSNDATWGGWHIVKSMAAPGLYYAIPDVDQKPYYQVRAVLRTGVGSTPAAPEIDVVEAPPPTGVMATTNTGLTPWYAYVGGEVNAVSGNLVLSTTDLPIQAKGFTISIVRTYNSAEANAPGPFGLGTSFNFGAHLSFPGNGNVTLTDGSGAFYMFVPLGGGGYGPPRGLHDNLVHKADGTYALEKPDGSTMEFSAAGVLTSLVDRNGNVLTLTYTGGELTSIADGSGLALTLTYDASGRIKTVTDPMGRTVQYSYNPSGTLATFTDPMTFMESYVYDPTTNRLAERVDRVGHVNQFVYDASGRVDQIWVYATNKGTWKVEEYAVDYVSGTETTVTNAAGSVTTLTFNGLGNPTSIVGPSVGCGLCGTGNSSAHTWDGEFDPLTATDGRGDTTSYAYDWMGDVVSATDPGGNTTLQTFLNVQNTTQFISLRTSLEDARGFTTRYTYTADGNLYATIEPGGNTSYRFYDAAGFLVRYEDLRGNSVTYGYNSHEVLTSSTDAGGNTTTYQVDLIGRAWNTTTPGGNTTRKGFDADSRVTSATDAMGQTTTYTYDDRGDLLTQLDPNLHTTAYGYNLTFGGIQTITDPGNNKTQYAYNILGERIRVEDADYHNITYGYDPFGRETSSTTGMGHTTQWVYDAAGNVIAVIEANGSVIRYTYDASNRRLTTLYPNGQSVVLTYDKDGHVVEDKGLELDEYYVYDSLGRVIRTHQVYLDTSLALWHNYTYDADGNRISMSGVGGGTSVWDANNRLYSQTDAAGHVWHYANTRDGQPLKETYPDGEYTLDAYDRDGRLTNESMYEADGTIVEGFVYGYDAAGNQNRSEAYQIYQALKPSGSSTAVYTTSNITLSTLSPPSQSQTVTVTVYASFFVTYGACPAPETVYWYYVLDGTAHEIGSESFTVVAAPMCSMSASGSFSAKVTIKNGDTIYGELGAEYVGMGVNRISITFAAWSLGATYRYDKQDRLYNVTYPGGMGAQYAYDAVGNRLTQTSGGSTTSYTYNADNELTSSSDGATYAYDANGNEVSRTAGSITYHFTYNYANQLATFTTAKPFSTSSWSYCGAAGACTATITFPTLVSPPGSATVTVSASGSLAYWAETYPKCGSATIVWYYVHNGVATEIGSQSFVVENGVTCGRAFSGTYTSGPVAFKTGDTLYGEVVLTVAPTQWSFSSESVATGPLGVPPGETLLYGPEGLQSGVAVEPSATSQHYAYDLLAAGGLPARVADYNGSALTAWYFYGALGGGQPLEMFEGSSYFLYHGDFLGSVVALTNDSGGGTVAGSYAYAAYGAPTQSSSLVSNPFGYTGSPVDSVTGFVHDGARFYDPTTGRFLTPDPLSSAGASAYAYAGDNPVTYDDPTGMMRYGGPGGGGGGTGGGISAPQCSLAQLLNGDCPSETGAGGGTGGAGTPGVVPHWQTDDCYAADTLFVIGLVLSILGLSFGSSKMLLWAGAAAGLSMAADVPGIISSWQANPLGSLGSIVDFAWTFITSLVIPSLNIWDAIEIGGETLVRITPPGFAASMGFAVVTNALAFGGLVAQGCIPPL